MVDQLCVLILHIHTLSAVPELYTLKKLQVEARQRCRDLTLCQCGAVLRLPCWILLVACWRTSVWRWMCLPRLTLGLCSGSSLRVDLPSMSSLMTRLAHWVVCSWLS